MELEEWEHARIDMGGRWSTIRMELTQPRCFVNWKRRATYPPAIAKLARFLPMGARRVAAFATQARKVQLARHLSSAAGEFL